MSEWRQVALRDIATDIKDGTHGTHARIETGIPFLSAKNVSASGKVVWDDEDEAISETEYRFITSSFSPQPGDLLVTVVGTLGRTAIFDGAKVAFQRSVAFVRPNKEVLPEYLFHASAALEFRRQLERRSNATAQAGLYLGELAKIRIPLPPLPRQRRIAEILSTLDEAIAQTEALIAKHQQIKAGLMHDLFTRGITPDGHLRPTREQAPDLYKESPLGWIPKEWDVVSIANAFEIQLGKMLNKLAKSGKWTAPYLGNRAVQWDFVDCAAVEEMDFTLAERQKFSLENRDLLVCEGGDVGRTAMWQGEIEGCFYQKAIHRLRPKSGNALPAFMLRFMRFAKEHGYFREFTSQSSIAHLTQEKLGAMPMLLPKPEEQKRIAERFDIHDELIQIEQARLAKFRQQKMGLMHDLLTSRVRVKSTESAPAHA